MCHPFHFALVLSEGVVFNHLYNHLHVNSILTPLQSGFIPDDSTTTQFTFFYDFFWQALDSSKKNMNGSL